jgi:two-component system cell cycle sensor histidine kinase/response regulator CckA
VRTLLAYARKQVFRQEALDIADALTDYYVLLRDIIDQRIRLDIVHGRDLPKIKVDKNQLETAITNLCTNARDAMLEKNGGGNLTIRTSRSDAAAARRDGFTHVIDGEYVLIEVIDDGAGIPPEIAPRVFDEFFTSKGAGARGLGLYLSRQIVREMRGSITFESAPGRTVFTVRLPAD